MTRIKILSIFLAGFLIIGIVINGYHEYQNHELGEESLSLSEAQHLARENNKPILVDFFSMR